MKHINAFTKKILLALANILLVSMAFVIGDALCQWVITDQTFINSLTSERANVIHTLCITIQVLIYLSWAMVNTTAE